MKTEEMMARTRRFALAINKPSGWVLGKQVLRSGISIGANYSEAQRSRTRAEFNSRIHLCQQEIEETIYWLSLVADANLVPAAKLTAITQEAGELRAIFMAISKSTSGPRS
jgi:four helix bundle protein